MGEEVDWDIASKALAKQTINEEYVETTSTKFALYPAYPNPFNPSTTLSFNLEKQSKVDIRIYNLQGQEVWSWGNNLEYGSGYHSVVWNTGNVAGRQLSSGVYFVRLTAGNQVATQKLIFMK